MPLCTMKFNQNIRLQRSKTPTEEVLMWILLHVDDNSLACDYDTAEKLREAVITMDATFLQ